MSEKNSNNQQEYQEEIIQVRKKRKKHPIIFSIFTTIFCVGVALVLTFVTVGTYVLKNIDQYATGPSVIDLDSYKNSQSQTSILYVTKADGTAVEETRLHGSENRIWCDYDEMPSNLLWAFVCLEDKRFYEHNGVDWIRTIGVLVKNDYEGQGGSTITQQLIKNLTGQNQTTFIRKFNEILRALNLERYYSKKDIIEAYLNTVYLGSGAYGVKTAAETYFGKEVSELSLAESALLAGITKAPYTLNPYYDMDAAKSRQKLCLKYMLDQGKINEKQYKKAVKAKINLIGKNSSDSSNKIDDDYILSWYDEYVIDQVISDLQAKYDYEYNEAWRKVYYGGISIYSAEDISVQDTLESIYENRSGFPSSRRNREGKLPNSSMTIMDYSGRIHAIVGGTGEKTVNRAYNRATNNQAKRQPGSSIKPLSVYAPAVNEGLITSKSLILEKSIVVDGRSWPRNFNGDHGSGSNITVQEALVRSLNTVPARILKEILGLDTAFKYANENFHLNLSSLDKTYSGLAVGGTYTGVTTLEMAAAFATFGNGGYYFKPYSYYKVVDRNGEVILDNTKNEGEQVLKTSTANSLLSMMEAAVTHSNGTGYGSKIRHFETFAKTGTTSDNCDKWYCGGTPYFVASVWYGYDKRDNLYTGSSNPSKTIFTYVFSKLHSDLSERTFEDNLTELGISIDDIEEITDSHHHSHGDDDDDDDDDDETESTSRSHSSTTSTTASTTESTTASTTAQTTTQTTTESTTKSTTESTKPSTEPSSQSGSKDTTAEDQDNEPTLEQESSKKSDDSKSDKPTQKGG